MFTKTRFRRIEGNVTDKKSRTQNQSPSAWRQIRLTPKTTPFRFRRKSADQATASMTAPAPSPPAAQIPSTAVPLPVLWSSLATLVTIRTPVAPNGWPIAIEPPCTVHNGFVDGVRPCSRGLLCLLLTHQQHGRSPLGQWGRISRRDGSLFGEHRSKSGKSFQICVASHNGIGVDPTPLGFDRRNLLFKSSARRLTHFSLLLPSLCSNQCATTDAKSVGYRHDVLLPVRRLCLSSSLCSSTSW